MNIFTHWPESTYTAVLLPTLSAGSTYNVETARAAMWLSQLVYEVDGAMVDRVAAAWGAVRSDVLKSSVDLGGPRAWVNSLVLEFPTLAFVAFRGTNPLSLPDLMISLADTPGPGSELHEGYERATNASLRDVVAAMAGIDPAKPIVLAGHSLGGALATVAAWLLSKSPPTTARSIASIYTFGQPRTGTATFANAYNASPLGAKTFRLVLGNDFVANLRLMSSTAHHVGHLNWCRHGQAFEHTVQQSLGSDEPKLAPTWPVRMTLSPKLGMQAGWLARLPTALVPDVFRDHFAESYVRAFARNNVVT